MIGKLIEIHPNDSFYLDREYFLGTLWDISEMWEWDESTPTKTIAGYRAGYAALAEPTPIRFKSNDPQYEEQIVFSPNKYTTFHAVKFEILEESGE